MKNVDLKRMQKLAGLLKEEKQPIKEGIKSDLDKTFKWKTFTFDVGTHVGRLYEMHGAKTDYDQSVREKYDPIVIETAIKYAPEYNKYMKEVDANMKKITKDPMFILLEKVIIARDELQGGRGVPNWYAFFLKYTK